MAQFSPTHYQSTQVTIFLLEVIRTAIKLESVTLEVTIHNRGWNSLSHRFFFFIARIATPSMFVKSQRLHFQYLCSANHFRSILQGRIKYHYSNELIGKPYKDNKYKRSTKCSKNDPRQKTHLYSLCINLILPTFLSNRFSDWF